MFKFTPTRNWYRSREESSSESETDSESSSDDDIQVITTRVYSPKMNERNKQKNKKSTKQKQPLPPGYVNFPVPAELLNQTQPVTYTVTISPADIKNQTDGSSQHQQANYQTSDTSAPSYIPVYFQTDQPTGPQYPQQLFTTAPAMGVPYQGNPMSPPNVPVMNLVYIPGYAQAMQYF